MRFKKIDMSGGLSYNSVLCVIQDHEQHLWVGTRDGLNKYNSLDIEVYKHDINDSSSLSHSHVNCLYESSDHSIWVGTANGLNKLNKHQNNFKQYLATNDSTGLSNQYVRCISEDERGRILIGTAFGINRYNPHTDLFIGNYMVVEAENGLIGWDMAVEYSPDLVISDVMMPEMDGIQLCSKLKSDSRTSHIPVVLLTARATSSFVNEGYETGADEYVTKPFSAEFLLIRVKNLIQQRILMRHYFTRQTILEPKEFTVTSVDERLLRRAVDYINENMEHHSISVDKLSKELGLSRVHFYRKIKALTSLTAVDFIRSVRLKKAAALLETNKLSVKEVQHMVGFDNADYFRKCFKTQFDKTPSDYAEQFRNCGHQTKS